MYLKLRCELRMQRAQLSQLKMTFQLFKNNFIIFKRYFFKNTGWLKGSMID